MAKVTNTSAGSERRPTVISDSGRVRIGSLSPALPPVRHETAKTDDMAKVRIGSLSPAFPAVRSK